MKRMMFMALAMGSLFSADVITAGTGGATEPLPGSPNPDDSCRTPGKGMPHFDPVVLGAIYGVGHITRSQYDRVKAGTLSIEDLEISADELQRLRCQDGGTSAADAYDPHFDPDLKPAISNVPAGTAVTFSPGHKPTDRVHRLTIDTGNAAIVSGNIVATITFAEAYEDSTSGLAAAPVVTTSPISDAGTFRVKQVTATSYDLYTDSGVAANTVQEVAILVQPVRRT